METLQQILSTRERRARLLYASRAFGPVHFLTCPKADKARQRGEYARASWYTTQHMLRAGRAALTVIGAIRGPVNWGR